MADPASMCSIGPVTASSPGAGSSGSRRALALAAAVAAPLLVGVLAYALRAAFHSDELNVLYHVERFARGEFRAPGRPGLLWMALVPVAWLGDPVSILLGGRIAAFLAVVAGAVCITLLGRPRDPDAPPSDVLLPATALGLLLTSGSWVAHGIELRTDTFTTPLTLLALVVLWSRSWTRRTIVLATLVVAAAVLCSQKSAYNALGLGLAWVLARPAAPGGTWDLRARARDAAVAVGLGGAAILGWYGLITLLAGNGSDLVSTNLERAASTAFADTVAWEDKVAWLGEAIQSAPLLWGGAAVGLVLAVPRARRDGRILASALVGAVLVAVIAIHRGFFPYYIASIEPLLALPAALTVVTLASAVARLVPRRSTLVAGLLALSLVAGAAWTQRERVQQAWEVTADGQLDLARSVRRIFPEPVPYVGGIHLVPGYPELAGYLTADAREAKRRQDRSFLATKLKSGARFFIRDYMTRDTYLKRPEKALLYRSYLPVSPNLYVHGARVRWEPGDGAGLRTAELFVDGPYTVRLRRGDAPLAVDGAPVSDGDVLTLTAGPHLLAVGPSETAGEAWLVLGEGTEPLPPGQHVDYSLFPKDRKGSRTRYQRYDRKRARYDLAAQPVSGRAATRLARHRRRLADLDARWEEQVLARRDEDPAGPGDSSDEDGEDPEEDPGEEDPADDPSGDEPDEE